MTRYANEPLQSSYWRKGQLLQKDFVEFFQRKPAPTPYDQERSIHLYEEIQYYLRQIHKSLAPLQDYRKKNTRQ